VAARNIGTLDYESGGALMNFIRHGVLTKTLSYRFSPAHIQLHPPKPSQHH
jgi:hypothetical protein